LSDQLGCYSCFHASIVDGKSPSDCRECAMCLRNPAIMSRKDNPKIINVDGIDFPFPIDMYITRDRLMYEDYMRAKKIVQAIQEELDKRQPGNVPRHDPWKDWYPQVPGQPKPYNPGGWWIHQPNWKYQKHTTSDNTRESPAESYCKSE